MSSSYRHPQSAIAGNVHLGERVYIAPFASIRADAPLTISIGNESNVQEGAVLKALGSDEGYDVAGERFALFVGDRVSISSQAQIHAPTWIADDVFVGMQALVMRAHRGAGSAIEPGARVIGVEVPAGRYVPAGTSIETQEAARALPKITESYDWRDAHRAMVLANTRLADVYSGHAAASPESK